MIPNIFEAFQKEGFELYLVGGFVRDTLLGRDCKDIDLATNAVPRDTIRILNSILGEFSVYKIGEEYGTIGLCYKDYNIEITTFRKEIYPTKSRKPTVIFGASLQEDLARRDFTINAMAMDATGEVYDPFNGKDDLARGIIKCVGSNDRFNEDPLRMMRAIRFACQLDFEMNLHIANPENLANISTERITDELSKILTSCNPEKGIRLLCDFGLMQYIIPEFLELQNVAQGKNHIKDVYDHSLLALKKSGEQSNDLSFRLACLLHDIGKPETKTEEISGVHFYRHQYVGCQKARTILERLKFDNNTIDEVCTLILYHMTPIMFEIVDIKRKTILRLIRSVGEENIYDLLDLVECDMRSSASPRHDLLNKLREVVFECMKEQPEKLVSPLNGKEIMEILDISPGKLVGEAKNYLTNLVLDGILDKDDKGRARTFLLERV